MMVWHGGLSGSAPLKVAEANHFLSDRIGIIPVNKTIFSSMNLSLFALFLLLIPITFFVLSKVKENRCTANTDLPKAVNSAIASSSGIMIQPFWAIPLLSITIVKKQQLVHIAINEILTNIVKQNIIT